MHAFTRHPSEVSLAEDDLHGLNWIPDAPPRRAWRRHARQASLLRSFYFRATGARAEPPVEARC